MKRWINSTQHNAARLSSRKHVVVVGGGLAGLSAAVVLSERGAQVTVLEKEAYLGGRVGAWTEKLPTGESFEMERGFHAFFRQYYNLRRLLQRMDPALSMLQPLEDYPILGPAGLEQTFRNLPKRAPFNVLKLLWQTPHLTFRDLRNANVKAALAMVRYDSSRTYARYDSQSAKDYLKELNLPPRAQQMLFDVFAHSFFNPETEFSAAELLMMFHFYFLGNPEGLVFDVVREPFSISLWRPLQEYVERFGVAIQTGVEVTRLARNTEPKDKRWTVETTNGEALTADATILAVTVPALQNIVRHSSDLGTPNWRAQIATLGVTRPFAVYRMWLDRDVHVQRAPFTGTAGVGILDNISLYHRFEGESARWAKQCQGAVVELHAYAVPQDKHEEVIKRELLDSLHVFFPETRVAKILHERFLLHQDCPAFAPHSHAMRPSVEVPDSGLAIAGDFVRTPFPTALMERATTTGFLAANHLLAQWQVQPEPLFTVG